MGKRQDVETESIEDAKNPYLGISDIFLEFVEKCKQSFTSFSQFSIVNKVSRLFQKIFQLKSTDFSSKL